MTINRRSFIKYSVAVAPFSRSLRYATAMAANRPKAQALPLGDSGFCIDVAPLAGADRSITDYSGFSYCPTVDALLLFGGGHAATPEDVVLRFPMASETWSADYPATPKATMLQTNADGTYTHLTSGKFWQVDGQVPRIRPVSRHTYSGFIWSSTIQRMLLPMSNNGTYYGFTNETVGGNVAEYDPIAKSWVDTGVPGCAASLAYCEDPVSGLIIAQDQGSFRVYDPRQRKWIVNVRLNAIPYFGYSSNVVYYPPTDRFYYLGRDIDPTVRCPRVWEYALDRSALRPIYTAPIDDYRGVPMATNWRPVIASGSRETGYAYDTENRIIVGNLLPGLMLGFRPNGDGTGTWLQQAAPGTTQSEFYCHEYVSSLNTHFVICNLAGSTGKRTFAFRWDPALAAIPLEYVGEPPISPEGATLASKVASDVDLRNDAAVLAYLEFKDVPTVLADLGRSNWQDAAHRAWYAVRHLADGTSFCADTPEFSTENGLAFMRFGGTRDIMAAHLFAPPGIRHAFARYVLVIEPDVPQFMTELGVKLPGLTGTYEDTILHPPHAGTKTFSWRMEHGPKTDLAVRDYLYDATSGSGYGNIRDYGRTFPVGVPVVIEQELDVDASKGRLWINDVLVGERVVISDVDIEQLFLNVYHGGIKYATAPIHYRLAAACIARQRIGVPPELRLAISNPPMTNPPISPTPADQEPHLPPAPTWKVWR